MAGSQKKININEGEDFDNFREVNAFRHFWPPVQTSELHNFQFSWILIRVWRWSCHTVGTSKSWLCLKVANPPTHPLVHSMTNN